MIIAAGPQKGVRDGCFDVMGLDAPKISCWMHHNNSLFCGPCLWTAQSYLTMQSPLGMFFLDILGNFLNFPFAAAVASKSVFVAKTDLQKSSSFTPSTALSATPKNVTRIVVNSTSAQTTASTTRDGFRLGFQNLEILSQPFSFKFEIITLFRFCFSMKNTG